jgi:hypothetical protein
VQELHVENRMLKKITEGQQNEIHCKDGALSQNERKLSHMEDLTVRT